VRKLFLHNRCRFAENLFEIFVKVSGIRRHGYAVDEIIPRVFVLFLCQSESFWRSW
jgi:hypothetical protein